MSQHYPQEEALQAIIARIEPLDVASQEAAQARQASLTKPAGSLGQLEALSVQIAGITGNPMPQLGRKVIVVMAADHGVVAEGVSVYPQDVTGQMVANFLQGGAAINVLARQVNAQVVVVDMGVASQINDQIAEHDGLIRMPIAPGTGNIAVGPAMSREDAVKSLLAGVAVVEQEIVKGLDILGTGEMGIGNSTGRAAIAVALTEKPATQIVGHGTGVDSQGLARKIAIVEKALAVNRPDRTDAVDLLAKVGGFEIGGLAGGMLAAAANRRPVVVDGFIATAAAMVAVLLAPAIRPYLIAAHLSQETGHGAMLDWLGLRPLLSLEMRLGEGTGAALAIGLVEAACNVLGEMATFGEAGVSGRVS